MTCSTKAFVDSKWSGIVLYFICWLGVLIFAKGFFPMKASTNGVASFSDVPAAPINANILTQLLQQESFTTSASTGDIGNNKKVTKVAAPFKKLVLIVIDAMRVDFLSSSQYKKHMPFLHSVLNKGHGIAYVSKAKAPTVTMPRLKALMTGSIPGYIDVVLNVEQSQELKEDNLVHGMKRVGKTLVFYGDDTWIRLFPNVFKRMDGTTSFFVTDYTEVDVNVTRHINDEIHKNKDWEVMILHYLGLDHIGHLAGPGSPLMPPKLNEMDSVIKSVYSSLQEDKEALLVLTSDHGMSGQGSHGGTTLSEVETPLVFMSSSIKSGSFSGINETVEQIDFASTVALLMGMPIPRSSLGRVIPSTLDVMNFSSQLHALQYNCYQLLTLASKSLSFGIESDTLYNSAFVLYRNGLQFHGSFLHGEDKGSTDLFSSAKANYISSQKLLCDGLTSKLASYNYGEMALGVVILSIGFCGVLFCWARSLLHYRHNMVMQSQSSLRITRAIFALSLGCFLHLATLPGSSFVEEEHQIWHFLTVSLVICLFAAFLRSIATVEKQSVSQVSKTSSLYDAQFNSNTVVRLRKYTENLKTWQTPSESSPNSVNENLAPNDTFSNAILAEDDEDHKDNSIIKKAHIKYVSIGFLAMIVHRVLRSWNQTGIKYAEAADIGDWFTIPGNRLFLSLISILGLTAIVILLQLLCNSRDFVRLLAVVVGLIAVYLYRVAVGAVVFPFYPISSSDHMGLLESRVAYICACVLLVKCTYHCVFVQYGSAEKRPRPRYSVPPLCLCCDAPTSILQALDCFICAIVVLSALLLRPHNHSVLAFNLFLYWAIFRLLWPVVVECRHSLLKVELTELNSSQLESPISSVEAVARVVLAYWFGQMAYFTMGNSNSFATVDLSAAYVGLSGSDGFFNLVCAALLASFSTYIGPILWTTLCVADIFKAGSIEPFSSASSVTKIITSTFSSLRLVSLAVYVAVATGHRYHLFIWSVFSPKLLYEIVSTSVLGVLLIVITLLS